MEYYNLCCQHRGQLVRITEKCGRVHVGKIANVDPKYVWIQPDRGAGGYGYGYQYGAPGYGAPHGGHGAAPVYAATHGYGPAPVYAATHGYGPAPVYAATHGHHHGGGVGRNPAFFPIALAGIGGFALGSAFFW